MHCKKFCKSSDDSSPRGKLNWILDNWNGFSRMDSIDPKMVYRIYAQSWALSLCLILFSLNKTQYWNSEKSSMESFDMQRGIGGNRNMFMEIFDHFKPQTALKYDIRDISKYLCIYYWKRSNIKFFGSLLILKYFGFECRCRMNVFNTQHARIWWSDKSIQIPSNW